MGRTETIESAGLPEEVDEELLALPAPARGRRMTTLVAMALAVAAALGLALSLRLDVAYFFASSAPVDLGEARELAADAVVPNRYVTVTGTPMAAYTVEYERVLGGERFAVFPLAGQRRVFVQVPLVGGERASAERSFSGRVVTFGQLGGRVEAVRRHLQEHLGLPVGVDTYLVLADEPPGSYVWALALLLLCVAFVALDVWLLFRWFRPLRLERNVTRDPEPEPG
ncbi:MAG: hypothetical protein AAGH15_21580 [Myxococcota bacterium]